MIRRKIVNEKLLKTWPMLYGKSGRGIKVWQVNVLSSNEDYGIISLVYGTENGKSIHTKKYIKSGKNVGKSNATTPITQALKEAQSKFDKQIQKGYVEDKKDLNKFKPFPMLAKDFNEAKHRIIYPCYIQPKLNGIRCIATKVNGEVKLTSRNCLEFKTLDHLKPEISALLSEGEYFDGEIYNHDLTFQDIVSYTKKYYKGNTEQLQYHIYDFPYNGDEFEGRYTRYKLFFDKVLSSNLKSVQSYEIANEQQVYEYHDKFVGQGYEGIIIRNANSLYQWNTRSFDLQKYKEFYDAEFTIIGYYAGTGTDAGAIVFKCRGDGKVVGRNHIFHVVPKGSIKSRRVMYKSGWKYVGKLLTVRYQNLSDQGKPVFPVGMEIRNYE